MAAPATTTKASTTDKRGRRVRPVTCLARSSLDTHTYKHSHTHAETVWGTKALLLTAAVRLTVLPIVVTAAVVVANVATRVVVSFVLMNVRSFNPSKECLAVVFFCIEAQITSVCVCGSHVERRRSQRYTQKSVVYLICFNTKLKSVDMATLPNPSFPSTSHLCSNPASFLVFTFIFGRNSLHMHFTFGPFKDSATFHT